MDLRGLGNSILGHTKLGGGKERARVVCDEGRKLLRCSYGAETNPMFTIMNVILP